MTYTVGYADSRPDRSGLSWEEVCDLLVDEDMTFYDAGGFEFDPHDVRIEDVDVRGELVASGYFDPDNSTNYIDLSVTVTPE